MFVKIFSYSIFIIISQWLVIKLLLASGELSHVGKYFYYLSLIAPLFMILGANFKNYATQLKYGSWRALFKYRLLSLSIITILVFFLFLWEKSEIILLALFVKATEYMLDAVQASEIRFNKVIHSTLLAFLMFLSVLLAYVLVVNNLFSLLGVLYFYCILLAINVTLSILRGTHFLSIEEKSNKAHSYKKIIYYIGFPAFLVSLTASIPRVAIEYFSGLESVAVFGSFIYIYLIAQVITIGLFQYDIKKIEKNGFGYLKKYFLYILALGLIGIAFSLLYGAYFIQILFSEALVKHKDYLPYFVGFILIGSFVQFVEQYYILTSNNKFLLKINMSMLGLSLIICPTFVFWFDLDGAVVYMYFLHSTKLFLLVYFSKSLKNIEVRSI